MGLIRSRPGEEPGEDGQHDQCCRGDDSHVVSRAVDDRLAGPAGAGPFLAHPRHEEHLVVHGQSEEYADQDDRQEADDGAAVRHTEYVGQPTPLEDGDDQPERGAHREQEADGGFDGDDQRAEHDHQQDQAEADDDGGEGEEGVAEPVGDVDVDRGGAGDRDGGSGGLTDVGTRLADVADELAGADAVRAGRGEDGDDVLRRVAGGPGRQDGLDVLEVRSFWATSAPACELAALVPFLVSVRTRSGPLKPAPNLSLIVS